ncbi:Fe-S oxidoreductase [Anditalea andensis]|uniref:Fe-S oxidoreductase n=1 Tax=Anditalea andensis TaxID=1048983 RepID=A0A074KQA9_9BACT|nr:Fe-S oxidoreductase [Anditalea andensis]KEO72106.1 Fe-S oxidoreductase [Anditalea andensis]
MNLQEKSLAVRKVFDELDSDVSLYLGKSGLTCYAGCGKCCMNPQVAATVLEFIPLAFDIYQKGNAEKAMDMLEQTSEQEYCMQFLKTAQDKESGVCNTYIYRGLICRLFGVSARRNKYGNKEMITCKKLKEGKQAIYQATTAGINMDMEVPMANDFYAKLSAIDINLSAETFPINQAIKKALEKVMMYKYYYENQE